MELVQHPLAILIGAGVFVGLLALLWVASKNWKVMRGIQDELHAAIHQVVPPMIETALTAHNRDEDAHEAAGIKVRKERNEMFNDLRDRMEEQHRTLLEAVTEVKANQNHMKETLGTVAETLTASVRNQEDLERRFAALRIEHENLHGRRKTDLVGLTFDQVRHELNAPRRGTDGEDEDHRTERKG